MQTIGCAASFDDPLHWVTLVMRSVELLVSIPLPGGQGPSAHSRLTVSVELVLPPLIVLTTVTVHVIDVVAPCGLGPTSLHWLTETFAAYAGVATPVRLDSVAAPSISRSASRVTCARDL